MSQPLAGPRADTHPHTEHTDDGGHADHADHGHEADHDHEHEHDHAAPSSFVARALHLVRPHSHDHADSTDDALESAAEGIRAVRIGLVVLVATAAVQGAVVSVSGSVALLADTVHNLSDGLTALPLWVAFVLVRRAPSRRYTYGLGRVEDLAGVVVLLMIAGSALVAGWESIRGLVDPHPIGHLWVVTAAGLVGFVGNEAVATYRIRVGRRIGSAALVADGRHARADGITSLGVVAGAVGVALGWPLADPVVGLVITVAILVILAGATREVGRRLLDGVDPALVDRVAAVLAGTAGVRGVDDLRLRWVGHRLHAEAQLTLDGGLGLAEADRIAVVAADRVRAQIPRLGRVALRPTGPAAADG